MGDDEEIGVAAIVGVAPRLGTKKDNPLRLKVAYEPPGGFVKDFFTRHIHPHWIDSSADQFRPGLVGFLYGTLIRIFSQLFPYLSGTNP